MERHLLSYNKTINIVKIVYTTQTKLHIHCNSYQNSNNTFMGID